MNWIKRNWIVVAGVTLYFAGTFTSGFWLGSPLTAHAQKNWRGETREEFCKANPDGIYSEGNGDMVTPCRTVPPGTYSGQAPMVSGGDVCTNCRIEFPNKKALDDYIDQHVKEHCVAVKPAYTEDLSGIASGQVLYGTPEQTLKLRCQ